MHADTSSATYPSLSPLKLLFAAMPWVLTSACAAHSRPKSQAAAGLIASVAHRIKCCLQSSTATKPFATSESPTTTKHYATSKSSTATKPFAASEPSTATKAGSNVLTAFCRTLRCESLKAACLSLAAHMAGCLPLADLKPARQRRCASL